MTRQGYNGSLGRNVTLTISSSQLTTRVAVEARKAQQVVTLSCDVLALHPLAVGSGLSESGLSDGTSDEFGVCANETSGVERKSRVFWAEQS